MSQESRVNIRNGQDCVALAKADLSRGITYIRKAGDAKLADELESVYDKLAAINHQITNRLRPQGDG